MRRLFEVTGSVEVAHILLYMWLLAGKIWIVYAGDIPLPHSLPIAVHVGWLFLGFACPIMVFTGYWFVHRWSGRISYFGLWLRAGGDIAQFLIMCIFLYGMLSHVYGVHRGHIFGAFFICALLNFILVMIVRDILTIAYIEQLAWRVRRE